MPSQLKPTSMQESFSPQQSLQVIQSMIEKTRGNLSENRFYFLLWGWLALTAILGQFFLKVVLRYERHYLVWLLTFAGIFLSVWHGRRTGRSRRVKTYIGDSMMYLWTGMGISFFVLCIIITFLPVSGTGWLTGYPFFIMMYGLGTFVSGKLLQFKPLVIGGVINWCLACAAVFFYFDYQMLFAAAAVLTSYIIPGYLLKKS
jgi:hypothetical protein